MILPYGQKRILAFAEGTGTIFGVNEQDRFLPEPNRIGLLTSTVLLALALSRWIPPRGITFELQLPGFLLALPLDAGALLNILTAALAAAGMDWLLRGHPSLNGRATFQWWYLPTLTTFVVSIALSTQPSGAAWVVGFLVGGALVFFVFLAEYVVVDADSPHYTLAVAGLTAMSHTLFFVLAVALRSGGVRLYLLLPALFMAAALTSLRILHLWMGGKWEAGWSLGIGLACVQLAAGLHYLPLTPLQFGLLLIGPLYGLTSLAIRLNEGAAVRRATVEPVMVAGLCWGLALLIR